MRAITKQINENQKEGARELIELPLSGWQLLGVNLNPDPHDVFTQLNKKLENVRLNGFSKETYDKREEILNLVATSLVETQLKDGTVGKGATKEENKDDDKIWISSEDKVSGLLLLLEAGLTEECLLIANNLINRKEKGVEGINENDREMNLLIDYAALACADEMKTKRFFESAARVLEERLSNNELSIISEVRERMKKELINLKPYRILDLVSREIDEKEHLSGIRLLEIMVQEKGGLEGNGVIGMSDEEFSSFFAQIRSYLTLQEQIDLYGRWCRDGSRAACFLKGIALVAAGFTQRKVKRIKEGLMDLEGLGSKELDPILSNIYLLLGDIKVAEDMLERNENEKFREWCKGVSGDKLGQQCAWCREWLKRDVLVGYRDIDTDPNLDAYFGDRDVIRDIEGPDVDRPEERYKTGTDYTRSWEEGFVRNKKHMVSGIELGNVSDGKSGESVSKRIMKAPSQWAKRMKDTYRMKIGVLTGIGIISMIGVGIYKERPNNKSSFLDNKKSKAEVVISKTNSERDLNRKRTDRLLEDAIRDWHLEKKKVLSGENRDLNRLKTASKDRIRELIIERSQDRMRGERQLIEVEIREVRLLRENNLEADVEATLLYSSRRLNAGGEEISRTSPHTFKRIYRLRQNNGRWIVS